MITTLFARFKNWLASGFGTTTSVAATAQPIRATDQNDAQDAQHLVPYDENLLERSRTQWQFGDWASLAAISRDTLQHHPDRAKLALLCAAGHQAEGSAAEARQYSRLALDWGCSKRVVSQFLISGVHNTLGRAASISGQHQRALRHFETAIHIGTPGSDTQLLYQARTHQQINQLRLPVSEISQINLTSNYEYFSLPNIAQKTVDRSGFLLINSVPKSGTYLISALLSKLGMLDSGLHFRNNHFWDFKNKPLDQVIANADQYKQSCDLSYRFSLINSSEFCVAHLEYDKNTKIILESFDTRHIFLVRNLRDALVSSMRFMADIRHIHRPSWANEPDSKKRFLAYLNAFGSKYLRSFGRQANWIDQPNVLLIRFEDIMGDNGYENQITTLQNLLKTAKISTTETDIIRILGSEVVGTKTRTYSGSRSNISEFWSSEAENIFIDHSGQSLNERFGYE